MRPGFTFGRATGQSRFFLMLLWLVLCIFTCSCSTTQNGSTNATTLFSHEPEGQGDSFRHRVKLLLPGQETPFSFVGLLQFIGEGGQTAQAVRVAGISGIGLRLFSIRLNREGHVIEYMHPVMADIAHLEDHIVLCVRSIWLKEDGVVGGENWRILRSEERPWPASLRFIHEDPDFEVQIRIVEYIPGKTP